MISPVNCSLIYGFVKKERFVLPELLMGSSSVNFERLHNVSFDAYKKNKSEFNAQVVHLHKN